MPGLQKMHDLRKWLLEPLKNELLDVPTNFVRERDQQIMPTLQHNHQQLSYLFFSHRVPVLHFFLLFVPESMH